MMIRRYRAHIISLVILFVFVWVGIVRIPSQMQVHAQVPTAWFQLGGNGGRVHSQGLVGGSRNSDSIISNVPNGKVFNQSRAITSASGQVNISPGSVAATPPPIPILKKYDVDASNMSYIKMYSRIQNPPLSVNGNSMQNAAPTDGLYVTAGNMRVRSWSLGAVSEPKYVVVFVNGNLTIGSNSGPSDNIVVQRGAFLAFIVKGNINIRKNVRDLQGIYYADGKICTKCDEDGDIDN